MSVPLRILLTTDALPPRCGGRGWSTWELAKGLAVRGHHVEFLKIETGAPAGITESHYESVPVTTLRMNTPQLPVIRNLAKNEWLWRDLASYLSDVRLARDRFDVLHAQDVTTAVPVIRAATACGIPAVVTVGDHWPICYWSNLVYDPGQPHLCPACSAHMMTRCIRPRAGAISAATWPLIPYMLSNLRTKRRTLADASAVITVSAFLARDLERRAPELAATPMFTIPHAIDVTAIDTIVESARRPFAGPYLLYVGQLSVEKGVQFLLPALERAKVPWPTVVVGDGPMRQTLERDALVKGLDVRFVGHLDRRDVLGWMRHASVLAFPSYGPEALSRVVLEAATLGVAVAAMDTGGTSDVLRHRVTGLLAVDLESFGQRSGRAQPRRAPSTCPRFGGPCRRPHAVWHRVRRGTSRGRVPPAAPAGSGVTRTALFQAGALAKPAQPLLGRTHPITFWDTAELTGQVGAHSQIVFEPRVERALAHTGPREQLSGIVSDATQPFRTPFRNFLIR